MQPNPPTPLPGKEGGENPATAVADSLTDEGNKGFRPSPPGGGAASGASGEGFRV